MENFNLYQGDCLDVLKSLPDNSVDSCVTDPPYGLSDHSLADTMACLQAWLAGEEYRPKKKGFMGRSWDAWVPGPEVWREVLRVLKPGGHLLAFAGTRSMDLMSMAVRLAGFEMRDAIGSASDGGDPTQAPLMAWCYATGFPKSMDVSKAIDKASGAERPDAIKGGHMGISIKGGDARNKDAAAIHSLECHGQINKGAAMRGTPVTDAARQWQGWGTALKPAWEPIILARKPLIGTVAENVLEHGTGAINVDGCRVGTESTRRSVNIIGVQQFGGANYRPQHDDEPVARENGSDSGRWPANLIHDGSEEVVALFPDSAGSGGSIPNVKVTGYGDKNVGTGKSEYFGGPRTKVDAGSGSAARFFYCAKASRRDRSEGMEEKELYYLNEDVPSDVLEKIYDALAK